MKILYFSAHPQLRLNSQSGPGTHMRETINALRQLGHEVCPVIIGDELAGGIQTVGQQVQQSPSRKLLKRLIPKIIWRSLKEMRLLGTDRFAGNFLLQKIAQFKPEMIYERGAYLQLSGINAAAKTGLRHFMELNAPFIEEVREFEQARTIWLPRAKRTEKLQVERPDLVYVVSSALKNYYSRYTNNPDKIVIVPNCVNPFYLKVDQSVRERLSVEFNLDGKRVIGFVGSIFPYHGVDILIRAYSAIATEFPETVLLIVGDGIILDDLRALSNGLGMKDRILFAGSRPHHEVFTWIDMMDICVMAKSNWYGSPVKIFEYGAMGKAIIAPDTLPVCDVMTDKVDGLLVSSCDADLQAALRELLVNSHLREKLALTFKQKVLSQYTWLKTAEKIIKDHESTGNKKNL